VVPPQTAGKGGLVQFEHRWKGSNQCKQAHGPGVPEGRQRQLHLGTRDLVRLQAGDAGAGGPGLAGRLEDAGLPLHTDSIVSNVHRLVPMGWRNSSRIRATGILKELGGMLRHSRLGLFDSTGSCSTPDTLHAGWSEPAWLWGAAGRGQLLG